MNIIFLDVDGVLNKVNKDEEHYGDKRPYTDYFYPFDEECLINIKNVVDETNAFIVITSTWKNDNIGKSILLEVLRRYNLDNRVVGYTENLSDKEEEIKKFLEILDENVNYIVIDDNGYSEFKDHLIKTNYENGFTELDKEVAIKKLMKR